MYLVTSACREIHCCEQTDPGEDMLRLTVTLISLLTLAARNAAVVLHSEICLL
jgi:hypothetical protein